MKTIFFWWNYFHVYINENRSVFLHFCHPFTAHQSPSQSIFSYGTPYHILLYDGRPKTLNPAGNASLQSVLPLICCLLVNPQLTLNVCVQWQFPYYDCLMVWCRYQIFHHLLLCSIPHSARAVFPSVIHDKRTPCYHNNWSSETVYTQNILFFTVRQ